MTRTYSRAQVKDQPLRNSGPYEAIIVNHHDPMYMGSVEVEILRYGGVGNSPMRTGQLVTAKYLSPFYGVTPVAGLNNNDAFHQTQKSYGFWMIPPDIGTRVLVIFAEGDPINSYWIGCIQDAYMNFMVPDGRAVTELTTSATPENLKGLKLPVGEYSKVNEDGSREDPTLFSKPYNKDFTEILEIQGLILDEARGLTTSSARRETPSAVFGFSTPGPLDKRQTHPTVKYGPNESAVDVPFNRLGGSSLVMDDGDDKFIRATHPADGPPLYVNKERGEPGGDETIPQNECIRIRTRTGHQILLHNSEDLIYITNSRGTAWIELTSDGKIDIHAEDSISIHTEQDFNFRAERDVNIEAGRNINMRASANWSDDKPSMNGQESGRVQIESKYDLALKGGRSTFLDTSESLDLNVEKEIKFTAKGDISFYSKQNIQTKADGAVSEQSGRGWYRKAGTTLTDQAEGNYFTQVGGNINVSSNGSIFETARNDKNITANSIFNTASAGFSVQAGSGFSLDSPTVDLNGGSSTPSTSASTFTKPDTSQSAGPQLARAMSQPIEFSSEAIPFSSNTFNTFSTENEPTSANGFTGSIPYIGPGGYNSSDAEATATNSPVPPLQAARTEGVKLHLLPRIRPGMIHPTVFDSIMKRVPQHEPWTHHENYDPQSFKPEDTDCENQTEFFSLDRVLTPDTFMKNKISRTTSVFVDGSGGMSSSSFLGSIPSGPDSRSVGNFDNSFAQTEGNGPLAPVKTKSGKSVQVAKVFQKNFQGFIDDLEATGYVIRSLGGYAHRKMVSNNASWSYHASGAAIDINPDKNGFFWRSKVGGRTITDMPSNTGELAAKWGLGWGGNWKRITDAMHFSAARAEGGSFDVRNNGRIPMPADESVAPPAKADETTQSSSTTATSSTGPV
jgi:hypothetical protein